MYRRTLMAAALLFAILSFAPAATAREYWAAMAICPDCKSISWSYCHPTADAAERAAKDRVLSEHSHANLLIVTRKPYLALARSPSNGYGYATGNTRAEAIAEATKHCLEHNSSVSRISVIKNTD